MSGKYIDLSNSDLEVFPDELRVASGEIEGIDISCNNFSALPNWISDFSSLRILRLEWNKFTDIRFVEDLPRIEEIYAGFNSIGKLPDMRESLKFLKRFAANDNPIEILDTDFQQELEFIDISNCLISSIENIHFPSSIRHLDLAGNRLKRIPRQLESLKKLEYLDISDNELSDMFCNFGMLNSLRELALNNNRLSSVTFDEFEFPPCISKLGISENGLTEIPTGLISSRFLVMLFLRKNRISSLPNWVKELPSLEVLELGGNLIPKTEFGKFGELVISEGVLD